MEKLKVIMNHDTGQVSIETTGFKGRKCVEAIKVLDPILKGPKDMKPKEEFNLEDEQAVSGTN